MTIREWLSNPSDFNIGKNLYEKHGRNAHLKKQFSSGRLQSKLVYELGKLVGVDEERLIPSQPQPSGISNDLILIDGITDSNSVPYSEQTHKEESIDHSAIKPLYDQRSMLHNQLSVMETDEQRLDAVEQIEKLTDQIEKILIPEQNKEKVEVITPPRSTEKEKMKRLQNLKTYISKHKDNKRRADDVEKWQLEKVDLEKELNEKA